MDGTAYCWGYNYSGQLGTTTGQECGAVSELFSSVPAPVSSSLKFKEISAGYRHTCAIALDDAAYCWGENTSGELGTGIFGGRTDTPVAVTGGLTFTSIEVGFALPTPVVGGLNFTSISVGVNLTACGVSGQTAYCWGDANGLTGTEDNPAVVVPTRVSGQQ